MNIKNTVTMAVGLVVGVLLIAGVVTPIIANVSSDGDGSGSGVETDITGFDRYAKVTDSTDVTIYPYYYNDTQQLGYSYTDPSEPDAQIHIFYGDPMVVGDGWVAFMSTAGSPSQMDARWELYWDGEYYFVSEFHLTGNSTVATVISTQASLNLPASIYYPSPDGQFVNPEKIDEDTGQFTHLPFYANSNSEVFCKIYYDNAGSQWRLCAVGTISDNTTWLELSEGISYSDSIAFTIEDGVVTGATFTVNGNTFDVTLPWEAEEGWGSISILPVSVYEGGGSEDSGLSPTLTTILSVIPLILTVGLVIGAIGFLRMKN